MPDFDDPDSMTPDNRKREVAAILATGYLRLRAIVAREAVLPAPTGQVPAAANIPREAQKGLDGPGDCTPLCAPAKQP